LTRRSNGGFVPKAVHRLEAEQVAVLREFLQAGKPVLACLGPVNEPPGMAFLPEPPGLDPLEALFAELGIQLGDRTVLFNADTKAFAADRRPNPLRAGGTVKPPPIDFDSSSAAAQGPWLGADPTELEPNPVRAGLRTTARSVGPAFDLRLRFPRPIYYDPYAKYGPLYLGAGPALRLVLAELPDRRPAHDPVFLLTAEGWNDDRPYATRERVPRYEPPESEDPTKREGPAVFTTEGVRRGPFSAGVAVETPLPAAWKTYGVPGSVRLAVIGQGDLFVGTELSPAREQLLLQTTNWLLGRDDYLPRADHPWSYPRLAMTAQAESLWLWGARLGLPVLFFYLGVVVLLVRRLR
jgi:hypothetical protein